MDRFKNVLFVYTGQPADVLAFERAVHLAERNQACLSLLACYEPVPGSAELSLGKERLEEINLVLEEKIVQQIDALVGTHGARLKHRLVSKEKNFLEIIYPVLEFHFDLVIKVKEDYNSSNSLSSVDMHLLRKCPCSVWIISASKDGRFPRILAAIDPSPTEQERVDLQHDILKLSTSLAQHEGAELDILYAWKFHAEATLKGPRFSMSNELVAGLARHEKAIHKNWFDETVRPFENLEIPFERHLLRGLASEVILEFVQANETDLLVMGTVARTGIPGLIIGNTAETVFSQVSCSILTLKPAGFKSPVKLTGRYSNV